MKQMPEKMLYERLASQGIRMFALAISPNIRLIYLHPQKTTEEWRGDIRSICIEIMQERLTGDRAINALLNKLQVAGYLEAVDIVSDVYECRVDKNEPGIFDAPIHSDQPDGFGHHGWESKT